MAGAAGPPLHCDALGDSEDELDMQALMSVKATVKRFPRPTTGSSGPSVFPTPNFDLDGASDDDLDMAAMVAGKAVKPLEALSRSSMAMQAAHTSAKSLEVPALERLAGAVLPGPKVVMDTDDKRPKTNTKLGWTGVGGPLTRDAADHQRIVTLMNKGREAAAIKRKLEAAEMSLDLRKTEEDISEMLTFFVID